MYCLIHGFTGGPESWDHVLNAAPELRPASCPGLPGHRGGEPVVEGMSFEDIIERFAPSVPDRSHLVGYSLGARVALSVALAHPEKQLRSLTLIGVNPGLEAERERSLRRQADEDWAVTLESEGIEAFVDRWESLPLFATQNMLSDARRQAQRSLRASQDPAQLARVLRQLGLGVMPSFWPKLATLEIPTRLVVGERDEKFSKIARSIQARTIWPLEIIGESGHNPVLERPKSVAGLMSSETMARFLHSFGA